MRTINKHSVTMAWVLLIAFQFVFLVKGIHSHEVCSHSCSHEDSRESQHDADSCFICHFLFSPFIVDDTQISFSEEIVYTYYHISLQEKAVTFPSFSFQLRAPPCRV